MRSDRGVRRTSGAGAGVIAGCWGVAFGCWGVALAADGAGEGALACGVMRGCSGGRCTLPSAPRPLSWMSAGEAPTAAAAGVTSPAAAVWLHMTYCSYTLVPPCVLVLSSTTWR